MQVDVIVSEWMGYALLFESMLDTVLYARDRSVPYSFVAVFKAQLQHTHRLDLSAWLSCLLMQKPFTSKSYPEHAAPASQRDIK